uniref:chaperonin GroEL n=1 Tax=Timspurckia oligopyrenoides TaxID=708627 RepID=UPI001FCD8D9D|nr:chaperonin GroEL [Timspurckia oligopyrenoides]UNJ17516.1 chaperonin GroEL [Timspurckia oligopyrenoides]
MKVITDSSKARRMILEGMEILSNALAVTIGPKGRNVVVAKQLENPRIINDGVTIAKYIQLRNKINNIGVSLIRQATSRTNDIAGDGTTTSTILAYAMVKQGLTRIDSGSSPVELRSGIKKATSFILQQILQNSSPISTIQAVANVASISAGNNREVGTIMSEAIAKIGRDGMLNIEEGQSSITKLEISQGLTFEKGFISSYFLGNSNDSTMSYSSSYVLLVAGQLSAAYSSVLTLLKQVKANNLPLLIIVEDIDKQSLASLINEKIKGEMQLMVVKASGLGEQTGLFLDDLSIFTGATIVGRYIANEPHQLSIKTLGMVEKVIVKRDSTTMIASANSDAVKMRCDVLRQQIRATDSLYEKQQIQYRLAKLTGGFANIKIGALTETEMQDKKLRFEDAINATKSAILEGFLPGGGIALLHMSRELTEWATLHLLGDELEGALIVAKSLELPSRQIIENSGSNSAQIIQKLKKLDIGMGYNSMSGEFCNMYDAGIIDPAKVTRCAVQNASSIANIILSTDSIILT